MVREDARAAEKSGQHHISPAGVSRAGQHQIVGHNAQVGAHVEYVPAFLAQDGHRRVFKRHRIALARNRLDQRRLSTPVRPQDSDMLIGPDAKAKVIERDFLPAHYADMPEIEQWRRFRSHRFQV